MREALSEQQRTAEALMRELLSENFLSLEVSDYELREDFNDERCRLTANVRELPAGRSFGIEGEGVGLIDAFFHGLCDRYAPEHPSLNSIKFSSFGVKGLMGDATGIASDAKAEATIGVTNSSGHEFEFRAISHSVSHSSMEAVLGAVEYFTNAERAYVQAYKAAQHYKKERRPELVSKYTAKLSVIVKNTSYSEVIERLKAEEK